MATDTSTLSHGPTPAPRRRLHLGRNKRVGDVVDAPLTQVAPEKPRACSSASRLDAAGRGLATVYGIVKQSEGFISADGATGKARPSGFASPSDFISYSPPVPASKEVAQMTKTLADRLRRRALL